MGSGLTEKTGMHKFIHTILDFTFPFITIKMMLADVHDLNKPIQISLQTASE